MEWKTTSSSSPASSSPPSPPPPSNATHPLDSSSSDFILMSTLFRDPPAARYSAFSALLLIYTFTVAANATLGLIICLESKLHRPMYLLMALLTLSDVAVVTNALPRIMANLVARNRISLLECVAQMFVYHVAIRLQAFILVAMSLDRYAAVVHPLRYGALASNARVLRSIPVLIAAAVLPVLAYANVASLDYCRPMVLLAPCCQVTFLSSLACTETRSYTALYYANLTTGLALPLVVILASYALIFRELHRGGRGGGGRGGGRRGGGVGKAAVHSCVTHFAVIAVSFGSVFFTFFSSLQLAMGLPGDLVVVFQTLQYFAPPALNPLIYGLRTADIRRSLAKAFGRRRVAPRARVVA
ncbi:olfactory receptor 2M4-like [Lampetra fluviatilis]